MVHEVQVFTRNVEKQKVIYVTYKGKYIAPLVLGTICVEYNGWFDSTPRAHGWWGWGAMQQQGLKYGREEFDLHSIVSKRLVLVWSKIGWSELYR